MDGTASDGWRHKGISNCSYWFFFGKEACKWTGCRILHKHTHTHDIKTSFRKLMGTASVDVESKEDDEDISLMTLGNSFKIGNFILKLRIIQFHPRSDDVVAERSEKWLRNYDLFASFNIQRAMTRAHYVGLSNWRTDTRTHTHSHERLHRSTVTARYATTRQSSSQLLIYSNHKILPL